MKTLDNIKLPKELTSATDAKLKYKVGELEDFDVAFKQKQNMLDEMENVNVHQTEEADSSRARLM